MKYALFLFAFSLLLTLIINLIASKFNFLIYKPDMNHKENFKNTGLQFCGLIMGDHSKCAINTMFNTGTVVGVSANIFGSGFARNFIPSFSWGGSAGFSIYRLSKVFDVVEKVFSRRNLKLDSLEKDILTYVYNMTKCYRKE